jgi:phospholipid/cholesterol/gamma-HCH transport system substrate-binding protein
MDKQAPSLPRIITMVVFSLSCVGLVLFLWLSFGGSVPLKPKGYQVHVHFPEATTLAEEADVRMAGVTIGKVRKKMLDKRGARTDVTLDIKPKFAPLPQNTRAILRQKTLLGETYVELTPGTKGAKKLADNGTLPNAQIEPTVELDEILRIFDPKTKDAYRQWIAESAAQISKGGGQDLNDALGNLATFAANGEGVLQVLNAQQSAVKRVISNTGVVFKALNERQGALRQLIVNSNDTFAALASRDTALAETFHIFPTFLDESKTTLARLERFSKNTNPLVTNLKPVADNLGPTVRDLGNLAPDLTTLFKRMDPLIKVGKADLPDAQRFLTGASPVFDGLHTFLPELNPILSWANYDQNILGAFLSNGQYATHHMVLGGSTNPPEFTLFQVGANDAHSIGFQPTRPAWERGQSYIAPNTYGRATAYGIIESFDCKPTGAPGNGEVKDPIDPDPKDPSSGIGPNSPNAAPPCFVAPPQLYSGQRFTRLDRGKAPLVPRPLGSESTEGPAKQQANK